MNNPQTPPGLRGRAGCADCGRDMAFDRYGLVACQYDGCALYAKPMRVAQWAERMGKLTPPPKGLPRPVYDGLPIPWATLTVLGVPLWRILYEPRVLECQMRRLCQVCGKELAEEPPTVLVDVHGQVNSDAALHAECGRITAASCPRARASLAEEAAFLVETRWDDIGVSTFDRGPYRSGPAPTVDPVPFTGEEMAGMFWLPLEAVPIEVRPRSWVLRPGSFATG